ncbi:MAG: peptide-methionine (S)-S-oxide reductase MsrA [archaeon]|jgi:methionine-S-sulfoxide reductase
MLKKAYFAGGCFWGIQKAFDSTKGVMNTSVGYSGGITKNPTSKEVYSKKTGHAETTQIDYDETKISYNELLTIFFKLHNPTELNMQGPDIGEQYRSAIFYTNKEQKLEVEKFIRQEQKKYTNKIVTQVEKFKEFFPADDYHQKYYKTHPGVC